MGKGPKQPEDEADRLAALRELCILDTPPEPAFDRLTALAADICGAPIALISLVDETRQWFKSAHGVEAHETGRDEAFCAHAILEEDTMVVKDATKDKRFKDHPMVTGGLCIRSYAGAPLITESGHRLGALCVIHNEVTSLSAQQVSVLEQLAGIATAEIEARARLMQMEAERLLMEEKTADLMHARSTLEKQASQLAELAEERDSLYHSIDRYRRFIEALLTTMPIPIFARDNDSRITHANPAYASFFGIDAGSMKGLHVSDVFPPHLVDIVLDSDKEFFAKSDERSVHEGRLDFGDGREPRDLEIYKAKLKTADGSVEGIVGAIVDVTDERALRAHLEVLATTDPLTSAGNRRAFMQHAEAEILRNRRYGHNLSMVLLDLDMFKSVNDTYGHQAGDAALKGLAKVCQDALRQPMDFFARLGGEEFAVLAVDTDIAGAVCLAERLRRLIASHCTIWAREKIFLTASLGVAAIERTSGNSLEDAMRRADKCLYAAKANGRNCVWMWDRHKGQPVRAGEVMADQA